MCDRHFGGEYGGQRPPTSESPIIFSLQPCAFALNPLISIYPTLVHFLHDKKKYDRDHCQLVGTGGIAPTGSYYQQPCSMAL